MEIERIKSSCNIIKDLLPSYLDGICSEETKDLVNGHLAQCRECRSLVRVMQDTKMVADKTDYLEIDYMKKVKKRLITKSFLGCLSLTVLVIFGLFSIFSDHLMLPLWSYYAILPIILTATNMIVPDLTTRSGKAQKIMFWAGILLTLYGILLTVFSILSVKSWTANGDYLFHMPREQVGPFLNMQYYGIALCLAAMYVHGIYRAFQEKAVNLLNMGIYLTGSCLMLAEASILKILTGVDHFIPNTLKVLIYLPLEGSITLFLLWIVRKWLTGRNMQSPWRR